MMGVMADAPRIGTRIARRRQVLGMTQDELAARLGVARSAVANWETGKHFPKRHLGAIEAVLGISLEEAQDDLSDFSPGLVKAIRDNIPDEADRERVFQFIRLVRSGHLPQRGESGEHRYREDRAG